MPAAARPILGRPDTGYGGIGGGVVMDCCAKDAGTRGDDGTTGGLTAIPSLPDFFLN